MNESESLPPNLSWHQLLAAYADGELDEATRVLVEHKLRGGADAANELDTQRRFSPTNKAFWNAMRPANPSEQQWNDLHSRIAESVHSDAAVGPTRVRRSRWLRRGLLATIVAAVPAATAAAVTLIVVLGRHPATPVHGPGSTDDGADAIVTTLPEDIDIQSMRPADARHLVVGQPPYPDEVTLVAVTDIQLDGVLPSRDGTMPEVSLVGDGPPIMFSPRPR
jgi:hypothetical protein